MKPKKNRKPGPMDNCQTPPYAVVPMLEWFYQYDMIWEPAAGEGWMVRALADGGQFRVIGSDIKHDIRFDYHDFLEHDPEPYASMCEAIITNPPYSLKFEWLERCTEIGLPWALLLPVETLGTKKFLQLAATEGFCVILMYPRVDFKMPDAGWDGSGAQFPVCWIMGSAKNGFLSAEHTGRFYVYELDKQSKKELKEMEAREYYATRF